MIAKNVQGMSLTAALVLTGLQAGTPAIAQGSFTDYSPVVTARSAQSHGFTSLLTQTNETSTLTFGQTVQGALGDADDVFFNDGTPVDQYSLITTETNSPYTITVNSSGFASISSIYRFDTVQQQWILQQQALVGAPNMQVQYSGLLSDPGEYAIQVFAIDGNLGAYTLNLSQGTTQSGGCSVASSDDPVINIGLNEPKDCSLISGEAFSFTDENGAEHFAKPFRFQATGAALSINATSTSFTPLIIVYDSQTFEILEAAEGTLTNSFAPGEVYFLISSVEAGSTGTFSVAVETNGGGFGSFSSSSVPFGLSGGLNRY